LATTSDKITWDLRLRPFTSDVSSNANLTFLEAPEVPPPALPRSRFRQPFPTTTPTTLSAAAAPCNCKKHATKPKINRKIRTKGTLLISLFAQAVSIFIKVLVCLQGGIVTCVNLE
jgi:hypothetical protein